jgi:hypothetical protein
VVRHENRHVPQRADTEWLAGRGAHRAEVRIGPRCWRGLRDAALHEFAHHLAEARHGWRVAMHGALFAACLREVTALAGAADYAWATEYRSLRASYGPGGVRKVVTCECGKRWEFHGRPHKCPGCGSATATYKGQAITTWWEPGSPPPSALSDAVLEREPRRKRQEEAPAVGSTPAPAGVPDKRRHYLCYRPPATVEYAERAFELQAGRAPAGVFSYRNMVWAGPLDPREVHGGQPAK